MSRRHLLHKKKNEKRVSVKRETLWSNSTVCTDKNHIADVERKVFAGGDVNDSLTDMKLPLMIKVVVV